MQQGPGKPESLAFLSFSFLEAEPRAGKTEPDLGRGCQVMCVV